MQHRSDEIGAVVAVHMRHRPRTRTVCMPRSGRNITSISHTQNIVKQQQDIAENGCLNARFLAVASGEMLVERMLWSVYWLCR